MANAQKITEIIDEKAFENWRQFVESLSLGQTRMAELVKEAQGFNKAMGGSTTLKNFSESASKTALALEKLQQEQKKTALAHERLVQAELRTVEMAERRAKAEAKKALEAEKAAKAEEDAAKRKAAADKLMAESEKDLSDSQAMGAEELSKAWDKKNKEGDKLSKTLSELGTAQKELNENSKETTAVVENETRLYGEYRMTFESLIKESLELKRALAEAKEELKEGEKGMGLSTNRTVELNKEIAELTQLLQVNGMEIRRMAKENVSAAGSIDELEAQLNSLRQAYRGLTQEERENSEEAKKLLAEIVKLDKAFKEQKRSMGQAQDDVGNYAAIWDQLPPSLTRVIDKLRGVDDANKSLSFTSIINGLKALTAQAWAFITTPLGATIAALGATIAGTKAWFDYNKGLQEATRLTEQLTEETDEVAKAIRDRALASAEVFGKDFNDILTTTNKLVREYGISFQEAGDLIDTAFIKGGDASGSLLANIDRFAPQLRVAGLEADELTALLIRNQKEGIFSDSGLNAIKDATLRIREMSDKTREALHGIGINSDEMQKSLLDGTLTMFEAVQKVSQEMKGFSDNSQEVGFVLSQIFRSTGRDVGLNFIRMLEEINVELETSVESYSDIEKAQLIQLDATERLNKEFSALFDATGGGFELMMADLKIITTEYLISFLNGIRRLYNWFVELYNGSTLVRGALASISVIVGEMLDLIRLMGSQALEVFTGLGNTIKDVLTGNFSNIKDGWRETLSEMDRNAETFNNRMFERMTRAAEEIRNGSLALISEPTEIDGDTGRRTPRTGGEGGSVGTEETETQRRFRINQAIRARQALEKRLSELAKLGLEERKRFIDEEIESYDKIVQEELNGFQDRYNNLVDFHDKSIESIKLQTEIEKAENEKLRADSVRAAAEGKREEAEVILKILKLKNEAVEAEELKAIRDLEEKTRQTLRQMLRDRYDEELLISTQAIEERVTAENLILAEQYAKGILNEREYAEKRLEVQNAVNKEFIENEIDQLSELIELGKLKGVETRDLERDLAALKIELSKLAADQQISDIERVVEMEKKAAEQRKAIYRDIAEASFEFFNTLMSNRLNDIDREIELNEEEEKRETERIERSSLNEEQKALRSYSVQQRFAQRSEELNRKRVEMERKQAVFNKAQAVLNIGLDTAQGITRAFKDFPFPISTGVAATVGALGAVQLAAVLAQQLPQYWTGTDSSEGGLAHVGERGAELFVTPDGKLGLTPPVDTIMNLEEGTKIFNANETKRILAGQSDSFGSAEIVNAIHENNITTKELIRAFKSHQVNSTLITKSGWRSQAMKVDSFNKYLRKHGIQ